MNEAEVEGVPATLLLLLGWAHLHSAVVELDVLHFAIVELVFRRGCHRVGKANIGASPVLPSSILIIIAVVIGGQGGGAMTRNITHHMIIPLYNLILRSDLAFGTTLQDHWSGQVWCVGSVLVGVNKNYKNYIQRKTPKTGLSDCQPATLCTYNNVFLNAFTI